MRKADPKSAHRPWLQIIGLTPTLAGQEGELFPWSFEEKGLRSIGKLATAEPRD